jgi:hypothetical protein
MTILDITLMSNVWTVILFWIVVYLSDYYLTLLGARIYTNTGKNYIEIEGSYELTPIFQGDIDSLRLISPTFLRLLLLSAGSILVLWILDVQLLNDHHLYVLLLGVLFLREIPIFIRHIRNIATFYLFSQSTDIKGQIHYPRWITLQISATELFIFGILFLLMYIPDASWFFIGGALGCIATAVQHYKSSLDSKPTPTPPTDQQDLSPSA